MSTASAKVGADDSDGAVPKPAGSARLWAPAASDPGESQPPAAGAPDVLAYESIEDGPYPVRIDRSADGRLTVVIPPRPGDRFGPVVLYSFWLAMPVLVAWLTLTARGPSAPVVQAVILAAAGTAAAVCVALIVRHGRHWAEPVVLEVDATHVSLYRPTDVRARRRWERARVSDVREEKGSGRGAYTKYVALVVDGRRTVTVIEGLGYWKRRHIIQAVRAALGMPPAE